MITIVLEMILRYINVSEDDYDEDEGDDKKVTLVRLPPPPLG